VQAELARTNEHKIALAQVMEGRHLADWLKNSLSMDKTTRFVDKKFIWLY